MAHGRILGWVLAVPLGMGGCSGSGLSDTAPPEQTVTVRVTADGILPDETVDLLVDGSPGDSLRPWLGESRSIRLSPGGHSIGLGELATNCERVGSPQFVTMPLTGDSPRIDLAIRCRATGPLVGLRFAFVESQLDDDGSVLIAEGDSLRFLAKGTAVSWSPDGASLVVAGYGNAGYSIREMRANGAGGDLLFSDWVPLGGPAWAPDGDEIAFNWCDGGTWASDCQSQVWALRKTKLGWAAHLVIPQSENPAWTPDGAILVVANRGRIQPLGRDGERFPSYHIPAGQAANAPAFSSDGRMLAYVGGQGGTPELRLHDIGTDEDRAAGTSLGSVRAVDWLPGHAGLIVESYSEVTQRVCLFVTDFDGTNAKPLVSCQRNLHGFALGPGDVH